MPGDRRVAILTGASLRSNSPGGVATHVISLVRFLHTKGIPSTIYTNGPADGLPASSKEVLVAQNHIPSTLGFHRTLRRWRTHHSFEDSALLHLHRPDDLWPLRPFDSLPPLVCTLHGNPQQGVRRRRGRGMGLAYRALERRVLPAFGAILAVDERTAQHYRRLYPGLSSRIRTVPIAVDIPNGTLPVALPPQNPETFLYVGRLSIEKRVDRVIDAMGAPLLRRAQLVIAGSGPEEGRLRRRAVGSPVTFLGAVSRADLRSWYQRADALVLASDFEGLPTVALEALSFGCPVVAPRGCGLDQVLNHGNGALVSDFSSLPEAMVSAAQLRRSGQPITVPPEFTWPHVGRLIIDIYREVAPGVGS